MRLADIKAKSGLLFLSVDSPTCSIKVMDKEPLLAQDLMKALNKIAPIDASYSHDVAESRLSKKGSSATHAHSHLKALFTGGNAMVLVEDGKVCVPKGQGLMLLEFFGAGDRTVLMRLVI